MADEESMVRLYSHITIKSLKYETEIYPLTRIQNVCTEEKRYEQSEDLQDRGADT